MHHSEGKGNPASSIQRPGPRAQGPASSVEHIQLTGRYSVHVWIIVVSGGERGWCNSLYCKGSDDLQPFWSFVPSNTGEAPKPPKATAEARRWKKQIRRPPPQLVYVVVSQTDPLIQDPVENVTATSMYLSAIESARIKAWRAKQLKK